MSDGEPGLTLEDVSKAFGSLQVLRRVSLSLSSGECVLLLGANGAGKSTLLRAIAGLCRIDKGRIVNSFAGKLSFFSQHLFLYLKLTVSENLRLFANIAGYKEVDSILERWGLARYRDTLVQDLSKGNQSRVALARAFMIKPSILLLDEPSSHLDDSGIGIFIEHVNELRDASDGAPLVVLASHDIHNLAGLASRVLALSHGQVLIDTGRDASEFERQQAIGLYRESNR